MPDVCSAYYTNYEIVLINTWFIAKSVCPERFEDIDRKERTDEMTETFLGKILSDAIDAMPNSFGGCSKIDAAAFFQ